MKIRILLVVLALTLSTPNARAEDPVDFYLSEVERAIQELTRFDLDAPEPTWIRAVGVVFPRAMLGVMSTAVGGAYEVNDFTISVAMALISLPTAVGYFGMERVVAEVHGPRYLRGPRREVFFMRLVNAIHKLDTLGHRIDADEYRKLKERFPEIAYYEGLSPAGRAGRWCLRQLAWANPVKNIASGAVTVGMVAAGLGLYRAFLHGLIH